jgi:Raf kinase inhibitor-like YbhB/YbcL family protein
VLRWSAAPPNTPSFAVAMCDTYKVPVSGWWHWIVYDLPPAMTGLLQGAGVRGGSDLPSGAKQGLPDGEAPEPHYYGPCPDVCDPPHHCVITVYARSVDHLGVSPTAMAAHITHVNQLRRHRYFDSTVTEAG